MKVGGITNPRFGRVLTVLFVALTTAGMWGMSGCSREKSGNAQRAANGGRVLLIGVDGVEWNVVLPLLEEGRLPNLAKLMERGQYGLVQTLLPTASPAIWTSVVTGKRPEKHGILEFAYPGPTGDLKLYTSQDRRTKAIWNILSEYGKRVCAIGWWMTYPVEEINGIMVAQTNTVAQLNTEYGRYISKGLLLKGKPGQVFPAARQNEMMGVLEDVEANLTEQTVRIFGRFRHPRALLEKRLWDNCQWAFRADATYLRIAANLLRSEEPFDLTLVYFGGTDVVGHRFWRYTYPDLYEHRPADEQIEDYGHLIRDYYVYADAAIGQLLAVSPPDVTVIILSDHGMAPDNVSEKFDRSHPPADVNSAAHRQAEPGFFVAAGPFIRPASSPGSVRGLRRKDLAAIGHVLDITPTILAMLDVPIGRDMDGRVLTGVLAEGVEGGNLDPVPTHDDAGFLAGRQKGGVSDPDQEERLRQLRSLGYLKGNK